ncbi:hypothetical protein SprV_0100222200 [Sparganum proliferum]
MCYSSGIDCEEKDTEKEPRHRGTPNQRFYNAISVSVPGLGLGRIFDVSSGDTSPSTSPPQRTFLADSLGSSTDSLSVGDSWRNLALSQTKETDVDITRKDLPAPPNNVDVIAVSRLDSSDAVATIRHREATRTASRWLVVHVRGTTTASGLSKSMLTSCMEWLETMGMSQILMAVDKKVLGSNPLGSSIYKSLLFLGFSALPSWTVAEQLPNLGETYSWLFTDLLDC